MAGRKRRRRSRRARRNPAPIAYRRRRRHGRRRRNPVGLQVKNVVPFAIKSGIRALEATGGKVAVRAVRRLANQRPGSIMGSVIEGGTAIVGGFLLSTFVNRELGEMFAVGGLQAPLETTVQRFGIPYVSDSLGDDGFYLGDGLGLVADQVDGYVPGESGVAGYVPGEGMAA